MVVWLVHYHKHTLRTFFPDKTTSWMSGHFNGIGKRTVKILLMPRLQPNHSSLGCQNTGIEQLYVAFRNRVNVSRKGHYWNNSMTIWDTNPYTSDCCPRKGLLIFLECHMLNGFSLIALKILWK